MFSHAKRVGYELFEPVVDEQDLNMLNSPDFSKEVG